jgi:hypothetical protein
LRAAAQDADAAFVSAKVAAVDTGARTVGLSISERIGYDAVVLAVGAEAMPAFDYVMTWDDRSDAEMLGGLVRDIEEGYTDRLSLSHQPARLRHVGSRRPDDRRADPQPLAWVGDRAVQLVTAELERAQIAVVSADQVSVERAGRLAIGCTRRGRG